MPSFRFERGELIEEPPRRPRGRYAPISLDEPPSAPAESVRARHPLMAHTAAERSGAEPGSDEADAAVRLFAMQRHQGREHARLLQELAPLWVAPEAGEDALDDRAEAAAVVAVSLRTTTARATSLLNDAHTAVHLLPEVFSRVESGDLPIEWHQRLIRSVRELSPVQLAEVDRRVASWDLASIPVARFRRGLRILIAWLHQWEDSAPRPEQQRDVALEGSAVDDGTACLRITGPVPEILAFARRLDSSARAVQDCQRHALADAAAADAAAVPFDIDGLASASGTPLPLADLRYAILTRSVLDTGGIEVPTERFRLSVVVPVMTLMGQSDAPGIVDGTTPIPASMARMLAAQESVWHRILTDPITGAYIPAKALSYRPPASMLEQLRMENPVCAAPGCTRSSSSHSEADRIEEYDHADPASGGPTSLRNFHLLCLTHHRLKTAGRIDPVRGPDGSTHWRIGGTSARIPPNRDLTTPMLAAALQDDWEQYHWGKEIHALMRSGVLDGPDTLDLAERARRYAPPPF